MRTTGREKGEQADADFISQTRLLSGVWMMCAPSFPHVIFSSIFFVADGRGQVAPIFLEARQSLFMGIEPLPFGKVTPIAGRETCFRKREQGFGMKERDGKSRRVGVYVSAWPCFASPHSWRAPF